MSGLILTWILTRPFSRHRLIPQLLVPSFARQSKTDVPAVYFYALWNHMMFFEGEKCSQMGWIGCAILLVPQKTIDRFQFLAYFAIFSSKLYEKHNYTFKKLFLVLNGTKNLPHYFIKFLCKRKRFILK